MTMIAKVILFVAVFGVFVVVGKSQSYDILCSDIKGYQCIHDDDCKCSGNRFICNRFSTCDRMTLDEVMWRQPCRGVFKSHCVEDSDCDCKGRKLICEANECVRDKNVPVFSKQ